MSVSRRIAVGLLVLGGSLLGAAPVAAQDAPSVAPPGNSAVDQYRESLPPSSGNVRKLNRRDRDGLARQGRDGEQLAAVLERSGGVPRAAPGRGSSGTAKRDERPDRRARPSRSAEAADAEPSVAEGDDRAAEGAIAPAAAASTVGPVPIWALLIGAVVLVGVGLVVRGRTARS